MYIHKVKTTAESRSIMRISDVLYFLPVKLPRLHFMILAMMFSGEPRNANAMQMQWIYGVAVPSIDNALQER